MAISVDATSYKLIFGAMAIIGLPITFGAAALIWFVSPRYMKQYSKFLFFHQMCSGLFEIYLHLLLPDFFFPVFGLTCYGPLGGLDSKVIGIIFPTVLMLLLTGIASCFIYRHRQVLPAGHWARPRPQILVAILAFQWVLCSTGLGVGGYIMPYTHDLTGPGMQLILTRHPSYRFLLDVPGLWILDDTDKGLQLAAFIFLVTLIYVSLTFIPAGFFMIFHSFYLLNSRLGHMSDATRQLQKKLIVNMLLQICVPLLTISVPWCVATYIIMNGIELPLAAPRAIVIFTALHAVISSVEMVILIKPYRQFLAVLFGAQSTRRGLNKLSLLSQQTGSKMRRNK